MLLDRIYALRYKRVDINKSRSVFPLMTCSGAAREKPDDALGRDGGPRSALVQTEES